MAGNFPEVWQSRVRKKLSTDHVATFLDGIDELDAQLTVDPITDKNTINIPLETFTPGVLLNNTTYPIDVEDHTDGSKTISLDKIQTLATRIGEDAALGASYDKIDSATKGHIQVINRLKFKKAIHAIAPASNTASTPIVFLPANYTSEDVYEALVALKGKFDDAQVDESGRRIVLSSRQYNKLLGDRNRFGDLLVDHNTGKVNKLVAGFEIYTYISNPYYTTAGAKLAWGAVPTTEQQASVAFQVDNIGKKTGILKQYYDAPTTTGQAHLINYRHYFIALPIKNEAIGAIVEGA
ncbi:hypothetical protein Pedsa_0947 [Pseudopedobacter saltans DSM 12145]|uniref:Uncharacterized protein n=1 Tax=Pseudopedobacter saltans (strain ATCC 51119 / DSM 12145 / JCM 21818 / CCUG 39354 / LMG 10337 / NBRC 100064 / NCIMB 13643) TaxID=762903 RepID=F0SAE2_PSESL|nr:hypothetical protein [Pseudopedobacter saltans]ADY51519.1 hypothetical protein Pedsa_0947 [Pseudopedobacter saltans DSM 12145]